MTAKEKVVFCWSGGKDSALALHRLREEGRYEVVSLLTTCNAQYQRVSMHGVRLALLDEQARAIGLPLEKVFVSERGSNEEYQQKMSECLRVHQARGVTACVFGDIFLEDLKQWREANLAKVGMKGIFPLWQVDTRELIDEFIAKGFGSAICCVNDGWLDAAALGRNIDEEFIASLPVGVDPCGENGEYHSFAFAGPVFQWRVKFVVGQKVFRPLELSHSGTKIEPAIATAKAPLRATQGFWFCDLVPV